MNMLRQYGFVKCASGSAGFLIRVEIHGVEVQGPQTGVGAEIIKDSYVADHDMFKIDTLLLQDRADIGSRASPF